GLRQALRRDLDAAPFDEATLQLVEALIRFLRRESVAVRLYQRGFLHAKSYLCFADRAPGDRFRPVAGIVGSSNFTRAGLTTNQELNLTHKVLLAPEEIADPEAAEAVRPVLAAAADGADLPLFAQPADAAGVELNARREIKSQVGARAILELLDWYDTRWGESRDFKADLIALLDESKFGAHEYTPYQIYLKTLYEYFRDELGGDGLPLPGVRSAVELTRFQEDAVQKARRILARYDGVLIADSVGLGKTWIGKKLLEDTAYHRRQKALVICPAALREMCGAPNCARPPSPPRSSPRSCWAAPTARSAPTATWTSSSSTNPTTSATPTPTATRTWSASSGPTAGWGGMASARRSSCSLPPPSTTPSSISITRSCSSPRATGPTSPPPGSAISTATSSTRAVRRRRGPAARPRRSSTCWRRWSSGARGLLSAKPIRRPPSTGRPSTGPSGSCTPCATIWKRPTRASMGMSSSPSKT
ncbi:MAG TPA: hypothetical protein ENN42_07015, partial [Thioalkalivibrio sp.]|nr:hypothetical protein [Thioalkalivibrio sp.]